MKQISELVNIKSMQIFGQSLSKLIKVGHEPLDIQSLDEFPLNAKQCIYLIDWSKPALVYSRGHETLLGYCKEDFSLNLVLNYFHTEDKEIVQRIVKAILAFCSSTPMEIGNAVMNMVCRIKKKDGQYSTILRQSSVHTTDDKGQMITSFTLLTDISFIEHRHSVEWDFESDAIDKELLKKQIYTAFKTLFTKREKEIIKLIDRGMTSPEIADQLHISTHTVSTHRKNMMRKSNCSSGNELLHFCRLKGIL